MGTKCGFTKILRLEGREAVPRYYFIVQTPEKQIDDDNGSILPNDGEAMVCALKIVNELSQEEAVKGWSMIVKDATGRVVSSIPFQQSLH